MAPATSPAVSWSWPSVADTEFTSAMSNDTGSAPNFSTFARSVAICWVKLPEISACPPVMASLTAGAETTSPSSTMANWFCGGSLLTEVLRGLGEELGAFAVEVEVDDPLADPGLAQARRSRRRCWRP